jgi:hypothetical protein
MTKEQTEERVPTSTIDSTGAATVNEALVDEATTVPEVPPTAQDPQFGVGDFPPELNRVNFGAVLMPIWVVVYGLWEWFLGIIGVSVIVALISIFIPRVEDNLVILWGFGLIQVVIYSAWQIFIGTRGNRMAWARTARVLAKPDAKTKMLVAHSLKSYKTNQTFWTGIGILYALYQFLNPILLSQPGVHTVATYVMPVLNLLTPLGLLIYDLAVLRPRAKRTQQ